MKRRFQFRLRTLFVVVTLAAVATWFAVAHLKAVQERNGVVDGLTAAVDKNDEQALLNSLSQKSRQALAGSADSKTDQGDQFAEFVIQRLRRQTPLSVVDVGIDDEERTIVAFRGRSVTGKLTLVSERDELKIDMTKTIATWKEMYQWAETAARGLQRGGAVTKGPPLKLGGVEMVAPTADLFLQAFDGIPGVTDDQEAPKHR